MQYSNCRAFPFFLSEKLSLLGRAYSCLFPVYCWGHSLIAVWLYFPLPRKRVILEWCWLFQDCLHTSRLITSIWMDSKSVLKGQICRNLCVILTRFAWVCPERRLGAGIWLDRLCPQENMGVEQLC